MDCLFNLPTSLCIKPSNHPGRGYGLWSLRDIYIRTRFGPYKGKLIESSEKQRGKGFQWKVETKEKTIVTLDGSEDKESSWLRYVNCAPNKEEQNLVATQHHSEVYFVTCKFIPANTQLLVWYNERSFEKRSHQIEGLSPGHNCNEMPNIMCLFTQKRINQERQCKETGQQSHATLFLMQPSSLFPSHLATHYPHLPKKSIPIDGVPSPEDQYKNISDVNLRESTQPENTLVIREKPFECEVCHKRYCRKDSLRDHQRDHTGERPYRCNICNKSFKTHSNHNSHKKTHTEERLHKCEICQKSYKKAQVLKLHKLRHTGERHFECAVCKKRFFTKPDLNKHKKIHTGEKPYECNVCHKKFGASKSLRNHLLVVHNGERRYECQICHSRFAVKCALRCHERIHTGEKPYECKVCHKKFRFDSPFRTHMKIHVKQRSYECQMCHKTITNRSINKKCCQQLPLKCKMCDKEYFRYSDFLKHKMVHRENFPLQVCTREIVETMEFK